MLPNSLFCKLGHPYNLVALYAFLRLRNSIANLFSHYAPVSFPRKGIEGEGKRKGRLGGKGKRKKEEKW